MKKERKDFTYKNLNESQKASFIMMMGLFLIVYSIICLTEGPGKYFRFPLTYLFGYHSFIYLFIILLIGFYMFIKRKRLKIFSLRQIIALCFFFFNLLVLTTISNKVDFNFLGSFKTYNNCFFDYFNSNEILNIKNTSGGLVGYMAVGILNYFASFNESKINIIIAIIVFALILLACLTIFLLPYILKIITFFKKRFPHEKNNLNDEIKFGFDNNSNLNKKSAIKDDLVEEKEVIISGNDFEYKNTLKEENTNHLKQMINVFDEDIYNLNNKKDNEDISNSNNNESFFINNEIYNDFNENETSNEKVSYEEVDTVPSFKEGNISNTNQSIGLNVSSDDVIIEENVISTNKNENIKEEETLKIMDNETIRKNEQEIKDVEEDEKEDIETSTISLSSYSYNLPPLYLLKEAVDNGANARNEEKAREKADILTNKMKELNVDAQITNYVVGPSVTRYEITLAAGVRVNTFVNLQEDFKLALGVNSIRIEAPIPGKSAIGIEVPNAFRAMVSMKEIITNLPNKKHKLYVPVGKDIGGKPISVGICDMPHCLISGATNSGKSVCANSIIVSLLMNYKPSEVRMIMVDPKRVEMLFYVDIPHLLCPIITDSNKAVIALDKLCKKMMERFDLFASLGVKNIASYNELMVSQGKEKMPFILLFVDEFAELMLTKKASLVEERVQKLVQLGRAAGVHLILCTQRPDVNVITGTIKANIPCRMTFRLSSLSDSRTVIDVGGAEKLLNNGDMLLLTPDYTGLRRVQGVYVSDDEINTIVEYCKKQMPPQYDKDFADLRSEEEIARERSALNDLASSPKDAKEASDDALYEQIKEYVINEGKASGSLIQRKFALGYNKAARMVDRLEEDGIVGPENGTKSREVLIHKENTTKDIEEE